MYNTTEHWFWYCWSLTESRKPCRSGARAVEKQYLLNADSLNAQVCDVVVWFQSIVLLAKVPRKDLSLESINGVQTNSQQFNQSNLDTWSFPFRAANEFYNIFYVQMGMQLQQPEMPKLLLADVTQFLRFERMFFIVYLQGRQR